MLTEASWLTVKEVIKQVLQVVNSLLMLNFISTCIGGSADL